MELLLNPNIAFLVLVVAFILTFIAILTPGSGVGEVTALLALIGAGYSIYYLPLNYLALVVLLLGAVPFLPEPGEQAEGRSQGEEVQHHRLGRQ